MKNFTHSSKEIRTAEILNQFCLVRGSNNWVGIINEQAMDWIFDVWR